MTKCATCGKFLSVKGGAACGKCKSKYHYACALLPETAKISKEWRCQNCKEKNAKLVNTATPKDILVGTHASPNSVTSYEDASDDDGDETSHVTQDTIVPSSQVNVGLELKRIRFEIQAMREERKRDMMEFQREMADFRQSLATCNSRVDSVESRLLALENKHEVVPSNSSVLQLENTVAQLKRDLNDREQELLLSDLEIANLPEVAGENVNHTVELIARKLGITLEARDIVFAERVGSPIHGSGKVGDSKEADASGSAPGAGVRGRRVVVRLARRGLRDELLRSARVRRGATSADLGLEAPPRPFYLNERIFRDPEVLNRHFSEVTGSDKVTISQLSYYEFHRFGNGGFALEPISEEVVLQIIRGLKSNALGCDGISLEMLKLTFPQSLSAITSIVNKSIATSSFPDLISRYQYVQLLGDGDSNEVTSAPHQIVRGVPQGSILGPLLFIIYSADIASSITHCKFHLYADDLQLYLSFPPQHCLESVMYAKAPNSCIPW